MKALKALAATSLVFAMLLTMGVLTVSAQEPTGSNAIRAFST